MKEKQPDFSEARLEGETVFSGQIITVVSDVVRLPNGANARREVVCHPGAAAIIPLFAGGEILLEWQYRYPLGKHLWEIPAGKIEAGEPPLATAQRELLEETGYRATRWQTVMTIATAAGFSDEYITLFLAEDLTHEGHPGEVDEFLQTQKFLLSDVWAMIDSGEIIDAKTVIALHWLSNRQSRR